MKYHIKPTDNELVMREDDFIVSKTDTKGIITYSNRIFQEFAGYTEKELLGKQHNIIRHPDMPRGIFKLLWDTIKKSDEIFAYVKNLSKDGSFYWTFANVTPVYEITGNLVGYYSVRRKPKREAISVVADLYRMMKAEEDRIGIKDGMDASLKLLSDILTQKNMTYEQFVLSI
jgi:PAS domain S-box-containing protein